MKVLSVEVNNLCAVEHLELEFNPEDSVVALTGRNGSGKSTALSAIRWLLTGKLPTAHNTKAQFQRIAGDKPASPSFAKLVFEADTGAQYRITGYLSSSSWSLEALDGSEELVEGRAAVTARCAELLSCDLDSLSRFAFIEQGKLQSVLFGSRAERVKALHLLLGLDSVERLRARLAELGGLVHVEDLAELIESLRGRCETAQTRKTELEQRIAAAKAEMENIDVAASQAVVDAGARVKSLVSSIRDCEIRITTETDTISRLESELQPLAESVETLGASLPGVHAALGVKRDELSARMVAVESRKRIAELKEQRRSAEVTRDASLADIQTRLAAVPAPLDNLQELEAERDALVTSCADINAKLSVVRSAVCPVCGKKCECSSDGAGAEAKLAELQAELTAADTRRRELHETINRNSGAAVDRRQLDNQRSLSESTFQTVCETVDQQLAPLELSLEGVLVGDQATEEAELLQLRETYNRELTEYEASRTRHTSASTLAAGKRSELETRKPQLQLLKDALARDKQELSVAPTATDVERHVELIRLHTSKKQQVALEQGHLDSVSSDLAQEQASLADYVRRQEIGVSLSLYRSSIDRVRDALHRDKLPSLVALGYMKVLVSLANEILPSFGAMFSVMLDSDGEMIAVKDNGDRIPTAGLSGGEACRWIVAFLFAVQGNAKAQCLLGISYADGRCVQKDDTQAFKWYRKSAEQGYAEAHVF